MDAEISAVFTNAGHIIGACSIELNLENKTLVFSGDVGRDNDVLMYPPTKPKKADYLFLESTYGNRLHPDTDAKAELEIYINNTVQKGGTIIIPSFAVERAQAIDVLALAAKEEDKIPNIPYIIDTPMEISALEIFANNRKWHKLPEQHYIGMCKMFSLISDYQETIEAIYDKSPKSNYCRQRNDYRRSGFELFGTLHWLARNHRNHHWLPSRGNSWSKIIGRRKKSKYEGNTIQYWPIFLEIQSLSAHGDQKDLLNWLSALENKPKKVFLVHGENQPADELI